MAGIGDLVAHLGIDHSGFKKGLAASRGLLSSFVGGVAGLISPIGAAFAGIAGVGGVGMLTKNSLESIDSLGKLSRSLGLTVSQLAGLHHAAELSGVSAESLDKAVARLTRQGVDVYKFANQIAAIEDPAKRVDLAMEAMGKQGVELLPLLMGGGDALKAMVDEGENLSRLKGVDTQQLEEANDAVTRIGAAFEGIGNVIAISLAPAIEFGANLMTGFVVHVGDVLQNIITWLQDVRFTAEWAFNNVGNLGMIAFDSIALGALGFWEDAKHLFTVQLPDVAVWLAENWESIFTDLFSWFGTAVENLADNIFNNISAMWDFIVSGGTSDMEFAWTPLTEGFESSLTELPNIASRELTDLERQLQTDIGGMAEALGTDFAEEFAKRSTELQGAAGNLDVPQFAGDEFSKGKKQKDLKAAFAGSQAAASIMLRGIGGKTMEQIAQKSLTVQQQTLVAVKANKPQTLTPLSLGT